MVAQHVFSFLRRMSISVISVFRYHNVILSIFRSFLFYVCLCIQRQHLNYSIGSGRLDP